MSPLFAPLAIALILVSTPGCTRSPTKASPSPTKALSGEEEDGGGSSSDTAMETSDASAGMQTSEDSADGSTPENEGPEGSSADGADQDGAVSSEPVLEWKKANLTNFESYPDPGSEECIEYNGCAWAGMFAALDDKMSEEWVKANNIVAVHSKDFEKYKLKTLRLKRNGKTIDVKVYDECSDGDCNGCCTKNAGGSSGFLIDIEKYTKQRFGNVSDGVIDWACVDCKK